jgi:hypothetical protein
MKGAQVKRFVLIAALGLGLTAFGAPTAMPAAPGDAQGPPCANIVDGDGSYTGTVGESGTVDFTIQLQASVCSFVTYSFFVTDTAGNPIAPTGPVTGDTQTCTLSTGAGCDQFVYDIASSPSTVCVYATTSIGGHIIDRAPNFSDPLCPASSPSISLAINSPPGASGAFN